MDLEQLRASIAATWRSSIVERLTAYVRIPNKSPMFDPAWEANGHMEAAVQLMADWCRSQPIPGMRVEIRRLPGRTPMLLVDVPGELPGLGPALRPSGQAAGIHRLAARPRPVGARAARRQALWPRRGGRWLCRLQLPHGHRRTQGAARGAAPLRPPDRGAARKAAASTCRRTSRRWAMRIGDPSLVVCLDAECGNYEQVWCTTSLRGNLVGLLHVRVLEEGVHSGHGDRHRTDAVPHCRAAARAPGEPDQRHAAARMSCRSPSRRTGARRSRPRRACSARRWPASFPGRAACAPSPTTRWSFSSTAPGRRRWP